MSEDFRVELWATAQRLVGVRQDLARWAAATPLSAERRDDVLLAAYEAMANSAEHAYPDDRGGPLVIRAWCEGTEVTVVVADEGRWKTPDPGETFRGRGLPLIGTLADDSATEHRDDGTTVTMRFRLT